MMKLECGLAYASILLGVAILGLPFGAVGQSFGKYPDARDRPIAGWTGPVFQLSQDYPASLPPLENYPWKRYDPKRQPAEYVRAVLAYAVEGNESVDWVVQKNKLRNWYHAPWMHWGRNGREFVHGMTHERVALAGELSPLQTKPAQNWAVSVYNERGAYAIGSLWVDPDKPKAILFPEGTVAIKLLFTAAPLDQVPYLRGSKEWDAYVYEEVSLPTNPLGSRAIRKLRLLQVDLAVKDSASDTTGWIFATLVYNGDLPGSTVFDRLEPVGLMWGNDPLLTVAAARKGEIVREGWINHSRDLPFQHLGWAGRLNGPVDNPNSSCLSCHGAAQWPAAPIVPPRTVAYDSQEWMRWFRNIRAPDTFAPPAASFDYSLQLMIGLANYNEWKAMSSSLGGSSNVPGIAPMMLQR